MPRRLSFLSSSMLVVFATLAVLSDAAVAQSNPYGRVDPLEASVSVLRRSIGGAGSPANVNELADFDLPGFVSILQAGVTNPSPPIRVRAAIGLAAAGEPIPLLLSRLDSTDERSALIIAAFSNGLLDPSIAGTIADHDDANDVALAILLAVADRAADAERLSRLAADPDTAWLTRGIAAATLEQRGTSALEGWFEAISNLTPAEHDRHVFEMLATVDRLGFDIAIERMPPLIGPRPSNDAIRAALVESLLELGSEAGIPAWNSMLADCPEDGLITPIGMLLVSAGQPAPIEAKDRFPSEDRMSKAVRELIFAAPDQRPQASIAAIELGHRPTMIWAMEKAEESGEIALLEAIFDAAARSTRTGIETFAIRASGALGTAAPSVLGRRLVDQEDRAIIEFVFRGLIAAGTPEAAAEARPYLEASDRTTRSLALLTVARADDLDDAQRRLLGRAAAGGGGLPQDLRPLAAWLFLDASGELKNSIPRIVEP
jgi:hypothetical protein